MPKVTKTFTIDGEFLELLDQETNASELVNSLLKKHYDDNSLIKQYEKTLNSLKEIEKKMLEQKDKSQASIEIQKKILEEQRLKEETERKAKLDEDFKVIESQNDLATEWLEAVKAEPSLINDGRGIITFVEKYRSRGITSVGAWNLQKYAEFKLGLNSGMINKG